MILNEFSRFEHLLKWLQFLIKDWLFSFCYLLVFWWGSYHEEMLINCICFELAYPDVYIQLVETFSFWQDSRTQSLLIDWFRTVAFWETLWLFLLYFCTILNYIPLSWMIRLLYDLSISLMVSYFSLCTSLQHLVGN